jgi:hypothetical protein
VAGVCGLGVDLSGDHLFGITSKTMSDHLAYIKIAGLTEDPEECFQGAGLTASGGESATGSTSNGLSWDNLTAKLDPLQAFFTGDFQGIVGLMEEAVPAEGSRALPPAIIGGAVAPWIAKALAAVAAVTGPAVPIVGGISAIHTLVNSGLKLVIDEIDPNSARNQAKTFLSSVQAIQDALEKGLLYSEQGETTLKGVLKQALLYALEINGQKETHSVIKDGLSDLALQDVTVKLGDIEAHVRGKALDIASP